MSWDSKTLYEGDDREEWLRLRHNGIGGSDAAGVLGRSPWSSPVSVFADKCLPVRVDGEEPERFYWGRMLEPLIVKRYQEETGRSVILDGRLLQNRARPWQLVTLDAFQLKKDQTGDGILEVKNTRWPMRDGVPDHYWIQMQHQFAVTGAAWGSFAVLVAGSEFFWADVERDDAFINGVLNPEEMSFWDRVLMGGPTPATDASKATTDALKLLYPKDDGATIVLPSEFNDDDTERLTILEDERTLKDRKAAIDNRIKAAIGDASFGVLPNGRQFSYKADKNGVRSLRAPNAEEPTL